MICMSSCSTLSWLVLFPLTCLLPVASVSFPDIPSHYHNRNTWLDEWGSLWHSGHHASNSNCSHWFQGSEDTFSPGPAALISHPPYSNYAGTVHRSGLTPCHSSGSNTVSWYEWPSANTSGTCYPELYHRFLSRTGMATFSRSFSAIIINWPKWRYKTTLYLWHFPH